MIHTEITLDLEKYGVKDTVVVSPPTFRRKVMLKNLLGKSMNARYSESGEAMVDSVNLGDAEVLKLLVYVKSAPFTMSIDSFLDFCEKLDDIELGRASEFYEELNEAVKKVETSKGPLEN